MALLEVSAVPSQVEATPEQREHEVAERRDDRHDKENGDDTIAQQQPEGGFFEPRLGQQHEALARHCTGAFVDACYNGLARATEVVDWAWGTKFPRGLKRRPIDVVLGADVLFTPWETTKLAAALDALHAHSPNLVFLLSVARVWSNAEAQCMAAFSDRGWRTRQLDPHPEDVRAASKGYVDDHLAAGQDRVPAGHLAIYEITKP